MNKTILNLILNILNFNENKLKAFDIFQNFNFY